MLKVYILSDDRDSSDQIGNFILNAKIIQLVGQSNEFSHLNSVVHSSNKPDLIIIDKRISDPELFGINEILRDSFYVIYITEYEDVDFFETRNLTYLTKPLDVKALFNSFKEVLVAISSTHSEMTGNHNFSDYFFIKCGKGRIVKIDVSEIEYIEANQNYITIYLLERKYSTNFTLNGIEDMLSSSQFLRVHRSFILNFSKIQSIEGNQIFLNRKVGIPIGQSYKKSIFDFFNRKVIGGSENN